MKKVISFSLWGNKPIYTIGAIKNAELALTMYPDFECWFYIHNTSVPIKIVNYLKSLPNVKIIIKSEDINICKPMCWRFEAIDDPNVEIMLSRDTDTRILLREKLAVDEWMNSTKSFHIMRDHPDHINTIMGGMFGVKKNINIPSWCVLINNIHQLSHRDYDQNFLNKYIYPIIKDDSIIHASFNKFEAHAKPFPIAYDEYFRFVGGYVNENDMFSLKHHNILKSYVHSSYKVYKL